MNEVMKWKVPKWPFLLADALLMGYAYYFVMHAPEGISYLKICAGAAGCVALGAVLGVIPFWLDYIAMGKAIEINALGSVAEKIQDLEQFTEKISAITDQWHVIQESVGQNAEKTGVAAKQIAEKMGAEVREFSEFMKKINDSEKAALRLEVEKARRAEAEWVQTMVRILDHIYALHAAAVRSSQPKLAEQITQFQNACRGTVRRIGLACYVAEPSEPYDAERHQIADPKQKPSDGAVIAETLAAGYTFQGKLLRPVAVRLREPSSSTQATPPTSPVTALPAGNGKVQSAPQDDLALDAD